MAQYDVWRLLAKNPSPLVVETENAVALFVLVSFVSAVSGLAALGETGEL